MPIYASPSLDRSQWLELREVENRFESQIQREIINLQERRAELSRRLALSKEQPASALEKQEIMQDFALLEHMRKFLGLLVEAIEKSRQGIAANLR